MNDFKALLTKENSPSSFQTTLTNLPFDFLSQQEVLIKVHYSSLNFKDALSASGHKGITRNFPHIPGIDASGTVLSDSSGTFRIGQEVFVTGFDFGMNSNGGLSEYISVPAHWVISLPENLSLKAVMELGTAGLTAGMAVKALQENHVLPSSGGDILVTGATGGVGMISILLLKHLGYSVVALTNKENQRDLLLSLGADQVILRAEFLANQDRALYAMQFAGAIDSVGGDVLVKTLKSLQFSGAVAACGMASSVDLAMQIYPFILRGARLLGIYSADSPLEFKKEIWHKFNAKWCIDTAKIIQEISLEEAPFYMSKMLEGASIGRKVVKIAKK